MTSSTLQPGGVTLQVLAGRVIALFAVALVCNSTVALHSSALKSSGTAGSSVERPDGALETAYKALPLSFEANHGQTDPGVSFLARGAGYTVFLTPREAVLRLQHAPRRLTSHMSAASPFSTSAVTGPAAAGVLRMNLLNANPNPRIHGSNPLLAKANYLVGSDTDKWHVDVPTFSQVRYQDVYPGIDVVYYGNLGRLEYDFLVAPEAEPARIRLALHGARQARLDPEGNLVMELETGGELRWERPISYQELNGIRHSVASRYALVEEDDAFTLAFELGSYDRTRPLVIDPVLEYSTFLGGLGDEVIRGIAVDLDGHAYVTGETSSVTFPTFQHAFQSTVSGPGDVFVTKFNRDGSGMVFSTYLGGTQGDGGERIVLSEDDRGTQAYVLGATNSSDFPVTERAIQPALAGGWDAFVVALSPDGRTLVYSTYLGGSGDENIDGSGGIAVVDRNAYVSGSTDSTDFPTTPGAFQRINAGSNDAFVARLSPSGQRLMYSTYLGGEGYDWAQAIAVDPFGAAYVTGGTGSILFPTTANAFQRIPTDADNVFVTKVNREGTSLVYSTFLGGVACDTGTGIAVDDGGRAYVTGATMSSDFPTTRGAFQTQIDGSPRADFDAFVTKFNRTGTAVLYSTYLGGTGYDIGVAIDIDRDGSAYVVGNTTSTDFPIRNAFQATNRGNVDLFVTKLNPGATALVYSSYLGGLFEDESEGSGITVDQFGAVYVTGQTRSSDFPTTRHAFQRAFGGGFSDGFVAKVNGSSRPVDAHRCETDHEHDGYDRDDRYHGDEDGTGKGDVPYPTTGCSSTSRACGGRRRADLRPASPLATSQQPETRLDPCPIAPNFSRQPRRSLTDGA